LKVVKYLISKGIHIDSLNNDELTPLHWSILGNHIQIVHYLIEQGSNFKLSDKYGYNSLIMAVQRGLILMSYYLLNRGIDIHFMDKQGHTALHWACYQGNLLMVDFLLNYGNANLNEKDVIQLTPLHWAVSCGHFHLVKHLIFKENIDIQAKDIHGNTPEQLAILKNNNKIAKYLHNANRFSFLLKKKINNFFWFILTMLIIPFLFWLFSNISFFISLIIFLIISLGINFTILQLSPDKISNSFLWYGIFISSFIVSAIAFFIKVINEIPTIESILFICSNFVLCFLYYYLFTSNPGII
jgi:ankyrin repeat protein